MPSKTRSQGARSRTTNPPSISTLPEDIGSLDIGDDASRPQTPVQQPSADHGLTEQNRQANAIGVPSTTPKHRKIASSVQSFQREEARVADPNDGRCFLTNQPRTAAVQICHLLARSTNHGTLTKLEYVWEIGYRQLHVDTKCNLFFLRAYWHVLFDKNDWLLVPENEVLQNLSKLYLEERRGTSDTTKIFADKTYRYYVLPIPTLEVPICRLPKIESRNHETHFPPFPALGPLEGHFHPHFVIVNSGRKLAKLGSRVSDMILSLSRIITPASDAISMVVAIQHLYEEWMGVKVPDSYRHVSGPSNRLYPPGEEGQDDGSQDRPPRRGGLRSGTRSQTSQASEGQYTGGQQHAILPIQASDDDDSSITDDTIVEDDTEWIEYIRDWQKQGEGTTEGWESDVLNDTCDKQLAAYIDEHARTPPSPGTWDSWKLAWDDRGLRYASTLDRSKFSSNDWTVFKSDVYLAGHLDQS